MTLLKCKMCGGTLEINSETKICTCEYCGSTQTIPSSDDEKKIKLFERANRLRFNCEFDKAAGIFESLVAEYPEDPEGFWGLILCRYGIEYVDDPKTGNKIPTCHRSSYESVMDDKDFEMVMEYADADTRTLYREEAKNIEELRKSIISVSANEEPYDIFICYKETEENGERTIDSVIAQEIYNALTEKGYKVFFSRITLEDKLGQEYEPYIFAALNSASVMLAIGTTYEHYNAVWVKNEWGRFLKLIEAGKKKTLIPCYKDIDAYDIPKEFAHLQGQDMGKIGFIQDLLRGIDKILDKSNKSVTNAQTQSTATIDSLLKRVFQFIEEKNWSSADEYCQKILDVTTDNGDVYLAQLLIANRVSSIKELELSKKLLDSDFAYRRLLKYGNSEIVDEITAINNKISQNIEKKKNVSRQRGRRIILSLVFTGLLVSLVILSGVVFIPHHYMKKAEECILSNQFDLAEEMYKKTLKYGFLDELEETDLISDKGRQSLQIINEYPEFLQCLETFNKGDLEDFLQISERYINDDYIINLRAQAYYELGCASLKKGDKEEAVSYLKNCREYSDTQDVLNTISYDEACDYMEKGFLNKAYEKFSIVGEDYKEAKNRKELCDKYRKFTGEWIQREKGAHFKVYVKVEENDPTAIINYDTGYGIITFSPVEISDDRLNVYMDSLLYKGELFKDIKLEINVAGDERNISMSRAREGSWLPRSVNGKIERLEEY